MWGTNRQPKSLASARSNIMAALGHMGMLTAQTCPRGLVLEVEHILQASWGLGLHPSPVPSLLPQGRLMSIISSVQLSTSLIAVSQASSARSASHPKQVLNARGIACNL